MGRWLIEECKSSFLVLVEQKNGLCCLVATHCTTRIILNTARYKLRCCHVFQDLYYSAAVRRVSTASCIRYIYLVLFGLIQYQTRRV